MVWLEARTLGDGQNKHQKAVHLSSEKVLTVSISVKNLAKLFIRKVVTVSTCEGISKASDS